MQPLLALLQIWRTPPFESVRQGPVVGMPCDKDGNDHDGSAAPMLNPLLQGPIRSPDFACAWRGRAALPCQLPATGSLELLIATNNTNSFSLFKLPVVALA